MIKIDLSNPCCYSGTRHNCKPVSDSAKKKGDGNGLLKKLLANAEHHVVMPFVDLSVIPVDTPFLQKEEAIIDALLKGDSRSNTTIQLVDLKKF